VPHSHSRNSRIDNELVFRMKDVVVRSWDERPEFGRQLASTSRSPHRGTMAHRA